MLLRYAIPWIGTMFGLSSCSAVTATYTFEGYNAADHAQAIKSIVVKAWSPPGHPKLAETVAEVAADLVKLRRNYLVYAAAPLQSHRLDECEEYDGVLTVRVLEVAQHDETVRLRLAMELMRCRDMLLVWRTEGYRSGKSNDRALAHLTHTYEQRLGAASIPWTAPAFGLMQDLLDSMPDPTLTDDELFEKLELGCSQGTPAHEPAFLNDPATPTAEDGIFREPASS